MRFLSLFVTTTALLASTASGMPYLRQEDLSGVAKNAQWTSLSQTVQFMPAEDTSGRLRKPMEELQSSRFLEQWERESFDEEEAMRYNETNPYEVQPFVHGLEEYDEYQQAWRMLGFMIDCNTVDDDDDQQASQNSEEVTEDGCTRYVLWAAVSREI